MSGKFTAYKVRRVIEVEIEAVDKHDAQMRIEMSKVLMFYPKGSIPKTVSRRVEARILSGDELTQVLYGARGMEVG